MKPLCKVSKNCRGGIALALLGLISMTAAHAQLIWDFSNDAGSTIQFNGAANNSPAGAVGSFQFNPATSGSFTGAQFSITDVQGGLSGDSVDLEGSITPPSAAFYYGAITTAGTTQFASILPNSTTGTLKIFDGTGYLAGTINLETISTFTPTIGGLNAGLQINLTNLSYSGTKTDLQTLVALEPGTLDLSFQFATPNHTLTQLSTGTTPFTTSYAGSISEAEPFIPDVPEPSTWALMLGGGGLLLGLRRLRRLS